MNETFKSFLDLPEEDRKEAFVRTAKRLNTRHEYAEKDFGFASSLTYSITVCRTDTRNCFSRAEHPCPRHSDSSIVSRKT